MHSVDMETRHGAGNYLRSLENRIRERAYEIWTARGCIQGQDDQHWLAAEREILTESTATLAVPETGASVARPRSKKSDWQRELRIKFFGMLFGVSIAAAAAFSLGAHHNGSAPASPGPIRETAAPASAPTVGAEVTAARVEATGVDTDRASTASDVTSDSKSNVATTCEASGAPPVKSWWAEETANDRCWRSMDQCSGNPGARDFAPAASPGTHQTRRVTAQRGRSRPAKYKAWAPGRRRFIRS